MLLLLCVCAGNMKHFDSFAHLCQTGLATDLLAENWLISYFIRTFLLNIFLFYQSTQLHPVHFPSTGSSKSFDRMTRQLLTQLNLEVSVIVSVEISNNDLFKIVVERSLLRVFAQQIIQLNNNPISLGSWIQMSINIFIISEC